MSTRDWRIWKPSSGLIGGLLFGTIVLLLCIFVSPVFGAIALGYIVGRACERFDV